MATKQHNIIVLSVSVVIAVAISYYQFNRHKSNNIESKVYESANGWGYDILVDNKLFIHQESVPGINGHTGFPEKEQAMQAASLIINKLKHGQLPTVTKFEINQICPLTALNGQ